MVIPKKIETCFQDGIDIGDVYLGVATEILNEFPTDPTRFA